MGLFVLYFGKKKNLITFLIIQFGWGKDMKVVR